MHDLLLRSCAIHTEPAVLNYMTKICLFVCLGFVWIVTKLELRIPALVAVCGFCL